MKNLIVEKLKLRVNELKQDGVSSNAIINSLKENLQYYLLHFIYSSSKYSSFVMYGGSILRVGYDLARMSEDLDFQSESFPNLNELKSDLIKYFSKNYNFDVDVTTKRRGKNDTSLVTVKFDILRQFQLDINWSVLKVRVDINVFPKIDRFVYEMIPKTRDELSFSIKTYPLSTLMASKAIAFLKRKRNIGTKKARCKPRDVYDMMWYMEKKIVPDLEYLKAKGIKYESFLDFRDAVKLHVSKLDDSEFKNDLAPFFLEPSYFKIWFSNWRVRFISLVDAYEFYEVEELAKIKIFRDFSTENRHFGFVYSTSGSRTVFFEIIISEYWYRFKDIKIKSGHRAKEIEGKVSAVGDYKLSDDDYEYAGLFYKKIRNFLKRSKHVVSQLEFKTKLIRATADNLNIKKQMFLDRRLIEKIDFEEMM